MGNMSYIPFDALMFTCIRDQYTNMMLNNLYEKHERTFHHSIRTAFLAMLIGDKYNLSCQEKGRETVNILSLVRGGLLHDIGNLATISSILDDIYENINLSEVNASLYRQHPALGYQLAREHIDDEIVLDIILNHHEKEDGSGFPNQLKGKEISIYAQIVTIADRLEIEIAGRKTECDAFCKHKFEQTEIIKHLREYDYNEIILSLLA